jgi:hypothetical protein
VTIFIIVMAEDWHIISQLYERSLGENDKSMGRAKAVAFFHLVIIVGNVILLAVFCALLLKNFTESDETMTEKKDTRLRL